MRFIFLFVVLVVGIGLFLQTEMDLPHLHWIGHLAGDLIIRKNGATLYLPLTTSLIASILLSLLLGRKR